VIEIKRSHKRRNITEYSKLKRSSINKSLKRNLNFPQIWSQLCSWIITKTKEISEKSCARFDRIAHFWLVSLIFWVVCFAQKIVSVKSVRFYLTKFSSFVFAWFPYSLQLNYYFRLYFVFLLFFPHDFQAFSSTSNLRIQLKMVRSQYLQN
jgi:hypothetical protein